MQLVLELSQRAYVNVSMRVVGLIVVMHVIGLIGVFPLHIWFRFFF